MAQSVHGAPQAWCYRTSGTEATSGPGSSRDRHSWRPWEHAWEIPRDIWASHPSRVICFWPLDAGQGIPRFSCGLESDHKSWGFLNWGLSKYLLIDLKPVAAFVRALLHVALLSRKFNMVVFWKTPYCNALRAQHYTEWTTSAEK